MDVDKGVNMISLLRSLANGATLRAYPLTGPMLETPGNVGFGVDKEPVQTLVDLGFLCPTEKRTEEDGTPYEEFELTEKTHRLIAEEVARNESDPNQHFWTVVANDGLFISKGVTPPNLNVLIGEEWNDGDRVVITCHDPRYVRSADLRLALAVTDSLFGDDLRAISEDFKYADAEVDAL